MRKRKTWIGVLCFIGMFVLILDGKTAIKGMQDGIKICLQTVIPSLFPFILLSPLLTNTLWGSSTKTIQKIGNICNLQEGSESLLIIGLLGGYPVGAQLIAQAYQEGKLTADSARRMLGFCNNAGPAFIFGILSTRFNRTIVSWSLWLIHIISAILVGILLPKCDNQNKTVIKSSKSISSTELVPNAIRTMATVSGWVLIFRVILGFCQRWFLWLLPTEIQVLFCGITELANGSIALASISNEALRFVLSSIILAFGGLCVSMQTAAVTKELGFGMYFPGKLLQTLFSAILSVALSPLLFPDTPFFTLIFISVPTLFLLSIMLTKIYKKKDVAFSGRMLYNTDI